MKTRYSRSVVPFVSMVFCLATSFESVCAANYTWDLDTAAGIQTGNGTWNTTDTNWTTTDISDSGWLQTDATTALHTATFAGTDVGTKAITLGEGVAAQSLTFSNSGYTLSAASAQTLALTNTGSGVISVASGKSATIGSNATVNFNSTSNTGQRVSLTGSSILNIAAGGTLTKTGIVSGSTATGSTLGFSGGVGTVNVEGTLSYNLTTPGNYGGIVISNGAANDNITLNVNNGGTVSSNSLNNGIAVVSANSGTRAGTLTVNTGGSVSTTGTSTATSGINLANGASSTGTVNLDGGTISTFQINSNYLNTSTNALSTGGTSTFNFHGGTLKAIANNTAFMGGLTNAFVKSGGAKFDTNGFNVTVAQQLKTDTVSLGGGLTKEGAGTLTLTGANTYTGGTSVNLGAVTIGHNTAFGTGSVAIGSGTTVSNSAALSGLANTFTGSGSFTTGTGQATITGNWSGFSGSVTTVSNADMVFNGAFSSGVSVTTSENAAYVNNYNLNNTNGMIVQNQTGTTGTYKLGSYASAVGSNLRNAGSATGSVIFEIGNLGTNTTVAGTIGGGAQTVSLTKVGSGTLTLGGANTYIGATLVSAGTLLVNGSLAGGSAVSVTGGTLGGSGTVAGTVAVSSGANLSAGNSIESLATGALTMASGSSYIFEVANNTSTGADLVAVNGTLSLTNVTLSLDAASILALSGGSWLGGNKLTLLSYLDGGSGITSGFAGYTDDTSYFFGSNEWTFNYNDTIAGANYNSDAIAAGQNRFVTLTLVPEPSIALLGGISLLALLRRRRLS